MLNTVEDELPSTSDLAKANGIEFQEITDNAARSTDNFIEQLEDTSSETLPMCDFQGLDKQLRSIRGSLKVEVGNKVELQQRIER